MGELVDSIQKARADLEHAARLMNTKGQTRQSRKQVSRLFADRALGLADVALQVARQAEELAKENERLKAEAVDQDEKEPLL